MKRQLLWLIVYLVILTTQIAMAQSTGNRIKENAKWKTENKANEKVDRAIDNVLEGNIFRKKDKSDRQTNGQDAENNGSTGNASSGSTSAYDPYHTKTDKEGNTDYTGYKNFDFIPGENILFFDDFASGLNQWNVVEWDAWEEHPKGKVVKLSNFQDQWYFMPRKGTSQHKSLVDLPQSFTLEYDMYIDEEKMSEHEGGLLNIFVKSAGLNINEYSYHFDRSPQILIDVHPSHTTLEIGAYREYGYEKGFDNTNRIFQELKENFWNRNKIHRVSISRNGSHVKLYINQEQVMDLPNAFPPNEKYTLLLCNNTWQYGIYITNVRLATGAPQPASAIKENKSFVTQNIYFNVNSDIIRPNSYQTLKAIAESLEQIEGKIKIVGHTDNDGSAQLNLALSQKRAASVKRTLVNEFGISADKLETDGKGLSEPLNNNRTPSEKAQNRRVEFIKL